MSNKDGFTLFEVLVAISILSIAMLAIASMQYSVVNGNITGRQFTSALEIARGQMELLKNEDVATSPLLSSTSTGANANNPIDGVYTCTWTVNDFSFDSDADGIDDTVSMFTRRVIVTVSWIKPGSRGGSRSVRLASLTMGNGM